MHADQVKMPAGTTLDTLVHGQSLVVTHAASAGDPIGSGLRINYVPIKRADAVYNAKIAVHGIFLPFPHLPPWDHVSALGGLMSGTGSIFDPPAQSRGGAVAASPCAHAAVVSGECASGGAPAGPSAAVDPFDLDDDGL